MTDAQWVTKTLEDPEAFAGLMEKYEAKLLRYIRRLSGFSQTMAQDVLQDVFIKIYRNLNDYDPEFSFSSWAYRIARNETINAFKKEKKHQFIPLETNSEELGGLIETLKSDVDLPEAFFHKDLQEKIQVLIHMLSPKYRDILVLRYLEDLDYKEISAILKKPMGTVATLVNRAKAQFKQLAQKNNLGVGVGLKAGAIL